MAADTKPRRRLNKAERRAQLLDAAETLLIERGAEAMTMERLAEYANVSKALPYSHFENSDRVLVEVYRRVVFVLGGRILAAVGAAEGTDARMEVLVQTYFDTVAELGPILSVVTAPGSRASELSETDDRVGSRFVTELLQKRFDVPARRARAAGPVLLGAMTGAVRAWASGDSDRRTAEDLCRNVLAAIVR